jgi:RNA polymerase sigma-70 factor, ECF subfamily
MNSSLTFGLPALAVPAEGGQTSMAPAASSVVNSETLDETLIIQICEGSREALAILFRRYARLVRGVSFRVLRDACEADDLVQDISLLVHRDCHTFDSSKGPAWSWILQMAYRRAISRRRYLTSRHFYTRLDLDDGASQLADPRASRGRFEDSAAGRLGNGGLQGGI